MGREVAGRASWEEGPERKNGSDEGLPRVQSRVRGRGEVAARIRGGEGVWTRERLWERGFPLGFPAPLLRFWPHMTFGRR